MVCPQPRFGDDRTVLFPRQGPAAFAPVIMRGARTEQIAGRVAAAITKWGADAVLVDGTGGYGAGVIDALRLANFDVIEVQFGSDADDKRKYANKRSEMYGRLRDWLPIGALP